SAKDRYSRSQEPCTAEASPGSPTLGRRKPPGPGGSPGIRSGPVFLPRRTQELHMSPLSILSLVPLLTALSGDTPLEQATRAFQAGEYAKVLVLAEGADTKTVDGARLLYLAGEADLALGAPAQAEPAFRAVLAARPQAVPAQIGLGRAL